MSMATEVSYAKSAETVTGGQLSRQCVRECILKLGAIEKRPQPYEPKRKVKELHHLCRRGSCPYAERGESKREKEQDGASCDSDREGVEEESKGRSRTMKCHALCR